MGNIEKYNYSEERRLGRLDCKMNVQNPDDASWDVYDDFGLEKVEGMYSKNPDRNKSDGIVAIDFGTKSTVVVILEKDIREPLSIGNIAKNINVVSKEEIKYIQNPTILYFCNFFKFIDEYNSREYRPFTDFNDLPTSWFAEETSKEYRTYFKELKQWATTNYGEIYLRDKYNDIILKNYEEEKEKDLIELYAYYIGSYINSQKRENGNKIFLDYNLSFPVTFKKEIKNKLLQSFKKGIRKSIPKSITESPSLRVSFSCSEPLAYALTSIEYLNLFPENDESNIMYAVYDFGGGTTDFDYGILSKIPVYEENDKYKYELESIHTYGNAYMGGENIKERIAIQIILENETNIENIYNNKIKIFLPKYCKEIIDSYASGSIEKKIKLEQIFETNRNEINYRNLQTLIKYSEAIFENKAISEDEFFYENITSNKENYESFIINFHENKEIKILVCYNKIIDFIRKVMKQGIKDFWINYNIYLEKVMQTDISYKNSKRHIFLAGNATKSEIFIEEFKKIMKNFEENKEIFLHYPLGSEESNKEIKEINKIFNHINDKEIFPNAKTGVAYGVLYKEKKGNIKVRSIEDSFKHTIKSTQGKNILTEESNVGDWVKLGSILEDEDALRYRENDNWKRIELTDEEIEMNVEWEIYVCVKDVDEYMYKLVSGKRKREEIVRILTNF